MSTQTAAAARTAAKGKAMPAKTTLNLVIRERTGPSPKKWAPLLALILLAAALFGKFAVADRFAALTAARKALLDKQSELAALEASYQDFDEVKARYNQYTYKGFDTSLVDRQDILDLLEREVFPHSDTRLVSVNGNVFSTTLTGLTLDEVSSMMARLEADPLIEGVTVFTAGYNETGSAEVPGVEPYATMTLVFKNADAVEGGDQ